MEDKKPYKVKLLRNWFGADGKKVLKGDVVSVDRDMANQMLASGVAEKTDARSFN